MGAQSFLSVLLNRCAPIGAVLPNLSRAVKLHTLRQNLTRFKDFLYPALWRVRFRVMAVLAFIASKVLDAFIGEVISSVLFN